MDWSLSGDSGSTPTTTFYSNRTPTYGWAPAPSPGAAFQPAGRPRQSFVPMDARGNDGHAPGGLGAATPGGSDAGFSAPGSGMGTAAPGMTIGNAFMNALSPIGTMIGALLGNNTFNPASGIPGSLVNIGKTMFGGNAANNGANHDNSAARAFGADANGLGGRVVGGGYASGYGGGYGGGGGGARSGGGNYGGGSLGGGPGAQGAGRSPGGPPGGW